jgi:hypothetical protein
MTAPTTCGPFRVILDDCAHYLWTFSLHQKSDTFPTLSHFFTFVSTQFGCTIWSVQCNNGREFDNSSHTFFLSHGVQLRMSCPYTSPQNGKAERIICTTNDVMRSLLFQASLLARYWAKSLHASTYLLNILPTKAILVPSTHFALFAITAPHKLTLCSYRCVFLGYSSEHKGYQCLNFDTNRFLVSRHVIYDESSFPFASSRRVGLPLLVHSYGFIDCSTSPFLCFRYPGAPNRATRGTGASAHITSGLDPSAHATHDTDVFVRTGAHARGMRGPVTTDRAMSGTSILVGIPSVPHASSTSRFAQDPLVYQRRHPPLVPEHSHVRPPIYHPVTVACGPAAPT